MSDMRLSVTGDFSALDGALERLEGALEEPEGLLMATAPLIRADVLAQFQAGGKPSWKPLEKSTVRQKEGAGYPRPNRSGEQSPKLMQNGEFGPENILIRTGAGLAGWTDEKDPNHIERVASSLGGDPELIFGVGGTLGYMAYHQYGRGVPLRPVTITKECAEAAAQTIEQKLKETIANGSSPGP